MTSIAPMTKVSVLYFWFFSTSEIRAAANPERIIPIARMMTTTRILSAGKKKIKPPRMSKNAPSDPNRIFIFGMVKGKVNKRMLWG